MLALVIVHHWRPVVAELTGLVVGLLLELRFVLERVVVHDVLLRRLLFVTLVVLLLLYWGERRKWRRNFLVRPNLCCTLAFRGLPHVDHFAFVVSYKEMLKRLCECHLL